MFVTLQAIHIDGRILSTRNEPVVPVAGGFMRKDGEEFAWLIEGVDFAWEIDKVEVTILGLKTHMDMPDEPENIRGNVYLNLPPLLIRIHAT